MPKERRSLTICPPPVGPTTIAEVLSEELYRCSSRFPKAGAWNEFARPFVLTDERCYLLKSLVVPAKCQSIDFVKADVAGSDSRFVLNRQCAHRESSAEHMDV